jgi:ParB family chromosome partitioning protein
MSLSDKDTNTKRLGKGLADLIRTTPAAAPSSFVMLRPEQIRSGRFQPRTKMSEAGLAELKASIKKSGVLEPVLVRPVAHGTYELIAGERRYRAAQAAGLTEIPAVIRPVSDREALEIGLVENIQREDLNPVEEAKGYERLLNEFGHTQEDVAAAVGKDRATIANLLRVLELPQEIREALAERQITLGHAKALLSITDRAAQLEAFRRIRKESLSVRQAETVASLSSPAKKRRAKRIDPSTQELENALRRALGTKVSVTARAKGGRIVIDYFNAEDLTRLLKLLGAAT